MMMRACCGGSCQVGTIQNSGVISTGANCDCVRRTQSCSGNSWTANTVQSAKKSCACSSASDSRAKACDSYSATTRERCQPAFGGGMPGSPNKACSASVWASASSTLTLSASRASSASHKVSTRLSGHIKLNSNMRDPVQR